MVARQNADEEQGKEQGQYESTDVLRSFYDDLRALGFVNEVSGKHIPLDYMHSATVQDGRRMLAACCRLQLMAQPPTGR
ncbi:hypothetical protein CVT25_001360 [Psilocybe cyanescens]|uniref:Uncharacterized protein n=1 Tax=Psilocybe cyanescens TaxID=93625 RepID=A0A409XET4_PSICY|nr:hypothetical protein CVT25_001360 [Psilocybe cyanescens]